MILHLGVTLTTPFSRHGLPDIGRKERKSAVFQRFYRSFENEPTLKNRWVQAEGELNCINAVVITQKKFTVDFLTKKQKVNEGEIPQYYIEESHEAIIDPSEWDAVQDEIKRRKSIGRAYSGKSVLSAKIVCGDCGEWYGLKTWHSNDKYKTVIWQCNRKYDKDKPGCSTPHFTEEKIKERFLKVYNGMLTDRDSVSTTAMKLRDKEYS